MSKLDAQRAMRAARYDAAHATSNTRAKAPSTDPAGAPAPRPTRAQSTAQVPATAAPAAELCGHRSSIGGKACRRPAGHTETTHRYT